MEKFEKERKELVKFLTETGKITTKPVSNAFLSIKRENFFPSSQTKFAYQDNAFSIGHGQTISQPTTIAIMLELLDVKEGMSVLEVGVGSGYVAALLSKIVGEKGKVFGVDIISELVEQAKTNLKKEKTTNTNIKLSKNSIGWKKYSLFDRILVSAATEKVPEDLFDQLAENGELVAPVGSFIHQHLVCYKKANGKIVEKNRLGYFVFVPLK